MASPSWTLAFQLQSGWTANPARLNRTNTSSHWSRPHPRPASDFWNLLYILKRQKARVSSWRIRKKYSCGSSLLLNKVFLLYPNIERIVNCLRLKCLTVWNGTHWLGVGEAPNEASTSMALFLFAGVIGDAELLSVFPMRRTRIRWTHPCLQDEEKR